MRGSRRQISEALVHRSRANVALLSIRGKPDPVASIFRAPVAFVESTGRGKCMVNLHLTATDDVIAILGEGDRRKQKSP